MARTSTKKETDVNATKEVVVEEVVKKQQKQSKKVIRDLPDSVQLSVKSNIKANLFFRNDRNGTTVTWREKDEIQFLSVQDIKHMKASQPRFLSDNWISIVGVADEEYGDMSIEDVYKCLAIQHFYKVNKITDEFEEQLEGTKSELQIFISKLTEKEKDLFRTFVNSLDEAKKENLSFGIITVLTQELGINFDE